jgi:hypothetical protein
LQIIYLAPFILLSAILSLAFLLVSRLRRHVISVAVAPIAFAACSITGVMATVLLAEQFGFDHRFGLDEPGDAGEIAFFSMYVFFGAVGATLAIFIVKRIQQWALNAVGLYRSD